MGNLALEGARPLELHLPSGPGLDERKLRLGKSWLFDLLARLGVGDHARTVDDIGTDIEGQGLAVKLGCSLEPNLVMPQPLPEEVLQAVEVSG